MWCAINDGTRTEWAPIGSVIIAEVRFVNHEMITDRHRTILQVNPFTPELKKCILPTFQKAIV